MTFTGVRGLPSWQQTADFEELRLESGSASDAKSPPQS